MANTITEQEALTLIARDERVAESISYKVNYQRELAEQMMRDARELLASARRTEQAVREEAWWELEGILDREDIESLCEVSPSDLLGGRS